MTTDTRELGDDVIERQVAELSARLDGSRRAKADILREVRHGLYDTADAYRQEGKPPEEAARAAIAEFGEPAALAKDFQLELASRQTRFALGFIAVSGPVIEVASRIQWSNTSVQPEQPPPAFTFMLAQALDVFGWGTSLIAVGLLLAMGFGMPQLSFRTRLAQFVAVGIVAKVVLVAVAGTALMFLFGLPLTFGDGLGVALGLVYPLLTVYAVWLAWRCLRTAGRVDRLAAA